MLSLAFLLLVTSTHSLLDSDAFQYMLNNSLYHNHLIGAIVPSSRITTMKYISDILYLATENGTLSIENTETNDLIHYTIDPDFRDGIIIDILPIQNTNSVAILMHLERNDQYIVTMIHVWPVFVNRVFLKQFNSPVCITNSLSESYILSILTPNSIISVNSEGHYITQQFANNTLPSQAMSCTFIQNGNFNGYLVHLENACFVSYLIDQNLNINTVNLQMMAAHKEMQSRAPLLISTAFGYISSNCIFTIAFDEESVTQNKAAPFYLRNIFNQFNISMHDIEVSDIQQTELQLALLFVTKSSIDDQKQMHIIYGNIPYEFSATNAPHSAVQDPRRRLLALKLRTATRTKYGAQEPPKKHRKIKAELPYSLRPPVIAAKKPSVTKPFTISSCDIIPVFSYGTVCKIEGITYQILNEIGAGSHGHVFKALRYSNAPVQITTVAIKEFDTRDLFSLENTLFTDLIGVDGVVQRIGASFPRFRSLRYLIVMDYISGGDLESFMDDPPIRFQFTSDEVIDLVKTFMLNISNPLRYFNDRLKWIHSDVKPENILCTYNDGRMEFYLSDMSCSLEIEEFTSKGDTSGTPLWMSPEMVAKVYVNEVRFPSEMCIDAYGLELVAMELYGALCQSDNVIRSAVQDFVCEEAQLFEQYYERIETSFGQETVGAFNVAFKDRSDSVSRLLKRLNFNRMLGNQRPNELVGRQIKLVNVLAYHLVRIPANGALQNMNWVKSSPSECISWSQWREIVESI